MLRRIVAALGAVFLLGAAAHAEGEVEVRAMAAGAASPPATIESIAWLEGNWVGMAMGGRAEETMSSPVGGQMMGMFRQTKPDGTLSFYEFYLFAEEAGSLVLKIKHFNPDMTSWEDKDEYVSFPLVAAEEGAAYFNGITYKLDGPDTLRVAVRVDEEGIVQFRFKRADMSE